MDKRFWISGVVMSIATLMAGFVVHGTLLAGDYQALGALYRPEAEQMNYFPYMILAHVLMGFAMTWIYRQGIDSGKSAVGQGLRFGFALALFSTIPWYLIYYAVQPLPASLVHKQMIFDTLSLLLLGVLVAYLNPRSRTS
jgi:hypothetical protein